MIAALCDRFGWPHDFWRRMGWRELRYWLRELNRLHERDAGRQVTDPDSWAGQEHDDWWAQQRERMRRMRGG